MTPPRELVPANGEIEAMFPNTIGTLPLVVTGSPDCYARPSAVGPPGGDGSGGSDGSGRTLRALISRVCLGLVGDGAPGSRAPSPCPGLASSSQTEAEARERGPGSERSPQDGSAPPLVVCEIKCPMATEFASVVRLRQRAVAQAIIYQRLVAQRQGRCAGTIADPPPLTALIQHSRIAAPGSTQAAVPAALHVFRLEDAEAAGGALPRLDFDHDEAHHAADLEMEHLAALSDGDELQRSAYGVLCAARARLWEAFGPDAGEPSGGRALLAAAVEAAGPAIDAEEARRMAALSEGEASDALRAFLCGTAGAGGEAAAPGTASESAALGTPVRSALDRIAVARPEGRVSVVLFSAAYAERYWEQHVLPPLRRYLGIALDLVGRRPPGDGAWPGTHRLTADDVAAWRGLAADDK